VLFADRVAEVEIQLAALEITNLRVIFDAEKNSAPGPEASMLKIRGTEIMQRISELQVEALGMPALAFEPRQGEAADDDVPRATSAYLNLRKLSIYGGSNEIQRNIIAQMILKLRG
jgi:alkylation response protein AidB-like acyl-CoA dehydrogenase